MTPSTHVFRFRAASRPNIMAKTTIKTPAIRTVSPHRYTMCHGGSSRYGQEAGRKHMSLCLRPASTILIDVNRSRASRRSFQVHPDKMLCFQGFAGFRRICSKLPNFRKSIESTGQNSFFGIAGSSSQIVVRRRR